MTDSDDLSTLDQPGSSGPNPHAQQPSNPTSTDTLRYRAIAFHAKGGLGRVSVAEDIELERQVALKELLDRHADHPETQARFIQEAKITGSLEHPGVVPIYGLGRTSTGRPYYAMRFIEGTSLATAIEHLHQPGLPAEEYRRELRRLINRFVAVCNTLHYAHTRGVIHRDIKPSNIMLGEFGETLVVDWGLAKHFDAQDEIQPLSDHFPTPSLSSSDSTRTTIGSVVGTPQFMSPEQAAGQIGLIGPASDIYSLGATLFYLLSGKTAAAGDSMTELLANVRSGELRKLESLQPGVPKSLIAICQKAMALAIPDRYQTAAEFADDLERWLGDEPVTAYRESWTDRLVRWNRRHRAWFRALSFAGLAIMITLSISLLLINEQKQNAVHERNTAQQLAIEKSALATEQQQLREAAEWQAAERSIERTLLLCDKDPAGGLLALSRDLAETERIGATDLQLFVRSQLGRWANEVHTLEEVVKTDRPIQLFIADPSRQRALICDAEDEPEWRSLQDGSPLNEGLPTGGPVTQAVISPDQKQLAAATAQPHVTIFDLETNSDAQTIPLAEPATVLTFSPTNNLLLIGTGKQAQLWDLGEHKLLEAKVELPQKIAGAVFHPKLPLLYLADWAGNINIYNTDLTPSDRPPLECGYPIYALAIHPQGKYLASGDLSNRAVLWDLETGSRWLSPLVHQGFVLRLEFDRTGERLITSSADLCVRMWEVASGRMIGSPMRHTHVAPAFNLSADGQTLWVACTDNALRRYRTAGSPSRRLKVPKNGNVVALHARTNDQTLLGITSTLIAGELRLDGQLLKWVRDQQKFEPMPSQTVSFGELTHFSNDGRWLATRDATNEQRVTIWNTLEDKLVASIDLDAKVTALLLNNVPAAKDYQAEIVIGTDSGQVNHYRLAPEPKLLAQHLHTGRVSTLNWLAAPASAPKLVSGAWDQTVRIWSPTIDQVDPLVSLEHSSLLTSVACTDDGSEFLTGGSDGAVRLWDGVTYQQRGGVIPHPARVTALRYWGTRNLIVATADGEIWFWDRILRQSIGKPLNVGREVIALELSHDGKSLFVASADWQLRQFHLEPWSESVADVMHKAERATNLRLSADGALLPLDAAAWE